MTTASASGTMRYGDGPGIPLYDYEYPLRQNHTNLYSKADRRMSNETDESEVAGVRTSEYPSVLALAIALVGLILVCIFLNNAIQSSAEKMDEIVDTEGVTTWWQFTIGALFTGAWVMLLCLVGIAATQKIKRKDKDAGHLPGSKNGCDAFSGSLGSYKSVTIFTILSYITVIIWTMALTLLGVCLAFYWAFTRASSAMCDEIKLFEHCIDLRALRPAAQLFIGENPNLLFCGNQLRNFCTPSLKLGAWLILSYLAGIIVLMGTLHFLMCMVSNWVRLAWRKATPALQPHLGRIQTYTKC